MKTNLFDLTGHECFCCAESSGENDIQAMASIPLNTLLIYPRNRGANKSPYLQNPNVPVIDDFYIDNEKFDFSQSIFLSKMLEGDIDDDKCDHLRYFFNYQCGILPNFDSSISNIILVPDNYDPEKQEKLLHCCGLSRDNTLLLWRSVAICLGAEEELLNSGVKEGNRIAVIDAQSSDTINISILTMKYDGEKLVPTRSSFNRKEKYPIVNGNTENIGFPMWSENGRIFWEHTWQRDGNFYVPDGDSWKKRTFKKNRRHYSDPLPFSTRNGIDFYIISGDIKIDFINCLNQNTVICEKEKSNFALLGAGRFSVRKANGLPTYFDECESLYFIIQDLNEEKILPKELIKGDEFCRGGKKITGVDNCDFVLGKDNDSVSFLMHVGEISNNTHLRELIQKFGRTAIENQPLVLHPSMIPGQGIANVIVEASPLLRDKVELDFSKMSLAYDKEHSNKPKTIQYLQETLPRSYPVDFPEAEASEDLWYKYCRNEVHLFLDFNISPDGGCFAHTTWPNAKLGGIDALKRINVFGTKKGAEFPIRGSNYFHLLFEKIAFNFKRTQSLDYVRLAAWTYHCGILEFQGIINQVLDKVKKKAFGKNISLQKVEFTVCANMLSLDEQKIFFRCFNEYVAPIVRNAEDSKHQTTITLVDEWIRALLWILVYSNELLRDISTRDCERCMYHLLIIWGNYIRHKTKPSQERFVRYVICCMLFLLRRRKYDHDFLRDESSQNYAKVVAMKQKIDKQSDDLFYSNAKLDIADAFFEYIENKGRLDIPMGGILNDGD